MFALMLGISPAAAVQAEEAGGDTSVSATATSDDSLVSPEIPKPRVMPISREEIEKMRELRELNAEKVREMQEIAAKRAALIASTTAPISKEEAEKMKEVIKEKREEVKQRAEFTREMLKQRAEFLREGTTTPAVSIAELKRLIEARKHELDDDEASSTPEVRDIVKHANPVRLAVHTLLASKDILGGIGPQVSEIAQHMNDSIATTTSAEAQIESRGFLRKIFFGGDRGSAEAISKAVAKNQEGVEKLTELLNQASTTAEVKTALEAQITALQDAQARLQDVAERERKLWGLFSWRF